MLTHLGFLGDKSYKEGFNRQQSSDPWRALWAELAMSPPQPQVLALSFAKSEELELAAVCDTEKEGGAGVQPVITIPLSSTWVLEKGVFYSVLVEHRGLRQNCVCPEAWGNHQA